MRHISRRCSTEVKIHRYLLIAVRVMACGLDDILRYHMVNSELYSASSPFGERVSENRDEEEVKKRISAAIPFLNKKTNISLY